MLAELASPQLIELGQLVGERMHITHIGFTDGLDLPLGAVQVAIPACIATMALERPVLGVDVELDTPAATWHGEIDASSAPTIGPDESGLVLDRYATCAQYLGQHDLRVRLVRCAGGEA